jgi:DNA-binding transcriptional ArsR family regulator
MSEIVLDRKTFGALAIESRVKIMKALRERRKTQSELSSELHMAVSTISEHLEKLVEAGLIKRKEDGHKWVYYELTPKGDQILSPQKSTSVFVFALSVSILMVGLGAMTFFNSELSPIYGQYAATGASGPGSASPDIRANNAADDMPTDASITAGAPVSGPVDKNASKAQETADNATPGPGNDSGQFYVSGYKTVQNVNSAAILTVTAGIIVLVFALYYWARS